MKIKCIYSLCSGYLVYKHNKCYFENDVCENITFLWQEFRKNEVTIKRMKGKALRKQSLQEKTSASVLLKLSISSNE